jgi:hypothetical protein
VSGVSFDSAKPFEDFLRMDELAATMTRGCTIRKCVAYSPSYGV